MRSPVRILPLTRRLRRDDRGVTAVEFGLIAPVLVLMIMGIVELGLMMNARNMLDNAVFQASRVSKTGYADSGKTQNQMILAAIQKATASYINASSVTLTSVAYNSNDDIPEPYVDANKNGKWDTGESYSDLNDNKKYDTSTGTSGYGTAGQIVVYTATYKWPLFTPMLSKLIGENGLVELTAKVIVKNEPYG